MLTLGDLPEKQVRGGLLGRSATASWTCARTTRLRYILVFKNHGEAAGATLEHTHSQLIALPVVPKRVQEEIGRRQALLRLPERCIFCDIIRQEIDDGARDRARDRALRRARARTPSRFPFETWILPKRHDSHFENIEIPEVQNLGWMHAGGAPQDRQGAGAARLQLDDPHRAHPGGRLAALPLAHRDHARS